MASWFSPGNMRFLRATLIVALLALYVTALVAALHPKVSAAYKAYYIDGTARVWRPDPSRQ
jgi:hypothetical protein